MAKTVVCIGGALIDELYYATEPMMPATTNMVTVEQSAGGVARNLAHQLSLLDVPVHLIAAFGDDAAGEWLARECRNENINVDSSVFGKQTTTGKYTGIINADGSLFTALLANNCNHLINPVHLQKQQDLLCSASYLIADTNLSVESLQWLTAFSRDKQVPLIIEPVSVPPAKKLQAVNLSGVFLITPNEDELPVICSVDYAAIEEQVNTLLGKGVANIWLHAGADGSVFYNSTGSFAVPAYKVPVKDSTGAGDGSLAGFVMAQWLGKNFMESVQTGHTLAAEILQVKGAIATNLTQKELLNKTHSIYL